MIRSGRGGGLRSHVTYQLCSNYALDACSLLRQKERGYISEHRCAAKRNRDSRELLTGAALDAVLAIIMYAQGAANNRIVLSAIKEEIHE